MSSVVQANIEAAKDYEGMLDRFLESMGYRVLSPMESQWLQRIGADREIVRDSPDGPIRMTVEYKQDRRTFLAGTGNVYIETDSIDEDGKGWAHTSLAQLLIHYFPRREGSRVTFAYMPRLKRVLTIKWRPQYPRRPTAPYLNEGYRTWGVCVPWEAFCKDAVFLTFPIDGLTFGFDDPDL